MFLSRNQIQDSLARLESIHPFYGTSFLVCKRAALPVGSAIPFTISEEETKLLDEFYKPDESSEYFYRVFRISDKKKHWVPRKKYASSTLQSFRTREFKDAFIHEKRTDSWGWRENYVSVLKANLSQNTPPYRNKRVPAFHLAVWLFRDRDWPRGVEAIRIVETFRTEFSISKLENAIFDFSIPRRLTGELFREKRVTWDELREVIGSPPDAKPEEGGTLAYLEMHGVGPSRKLVFEPAERLNLITGDNGLGKTFLLECSWWALTGQWTDRMMQAYPRPDAGRSEPKMILQIAGERRRVEKTTVAYDWKTYNWHATKKRPTIPGLVVYARVDGSFAVWDPARRQPSEAERFNGDLPAPLVFTRTQVWSGQEGKIEGLLRDWVRWQSNPEKHPFEVFTRVLNRLSPPDLGPLEPGEPTRLPYEHREVPTLKHPYGEVPIVQASAGVRRIVTLAYLIVWAWNEHKIYSELARVEPQRRMVILVDEMEAHLHPQWQRAVVPSVLDVGSELASKLKVQLIVATHSPLVMASVEAVFDEMKDKLFHLDLTADGKVSFRELRFIKYGGVNSWLTSEVFEMRYARSKEAEEAIVRAKNLQSEDDPNRAEVNRVHDDLSKFLASDDEFWPRWIYFAEQHGVKL